VGRRLLGNPITGIAACARRERPRHRRAAELLTAPSPEPDGTLIAVIEMSQSSWLVA
jgi:hypothetical protein